MKEDSDTYDLCSEPWLPCEDLDGKSVNVGLVDALVRAHELRCLADPSPLVTAAITRMLLAIVHRSVGGPGTMAAWLDLVRAGRLPADRVRQYLESVRSRMNLFDPERPFAQVRGLGVDASEASTLVTQRSNWGGGTGLFHHRSSADDASLAPDVAARWLVTRQAFDVGGLVSGKPKSASASPLTATAVVLVRGESLFEALVSNLLVYSPDRSLPIPGHGMDRPHWEQDVQSAVLLAESEPKRVPSGWLDALTWLSRRIELVVERRRVVAWKKAAWQGLATEAALDPMVAWVIDEKMGHRAVRIDSGRAFWRNSHALFQGAASGARKHKRPAALAQLARDEARKLMPDDRRFQIDVLGMATYQASVEMERWERLATTGKLLADPDAADEVRGGVEIVESVFRVLKEGLETFARGALSPGGRDPKEDVTRMLESLGFAAEFWSASETIFSEFLNSLSKEGRVAARGQLLVGCTRIAEACFERAVRALGEHGRMMRATASASGRFRRRLACLYNANEEGAP